MINDKGHHAFYYFFFNDTATTEIYTLSLHDALPISISDADFELQCSLKVVNRLDNEFVRQFRAVDVRSEEHTSEIQYVRISYAVFCLKKKIQRSSHFLD